MVKVKIRALLPLLLIYINISSGENRIGFGGLLNHGRDNLSTLGTRYI